MVSVDLSGAKKAVLLKRFRAHRRIRAIVQSSSVQADLTARELGVPQDKLCLLPPGVDVDFWEPQEGSQGRTFCAVGWEARDYATLIRAVSGLDARLEVARGTITPLRRAPPRRAVRTAPAALPRHSTSSPSRPCGGLPATRCSSSGSRPSAAMSCRTTSPGTAS